MIAVPLDEAYIQWLYSQVGSVKIRHSSSTYWNLLRQLYTKEFVWFVPNDDNRAEDGKSLRYEFIEELELELVDRESREWMLMPCSFLEMIIALAKRMAREDGDSPRGWFWHFIQVLGLDVYADNIDLPHQEIEEILDRVIWRTYRRDGHGGLFPLKHPREDQREVEIWYQFSAYFRENNL